MFRLCGLQVASVHNDGMLPSLAVSVVSRTANPMCCKAWPRTLCAVDTVAILTKAAVTNRFQSNSLLFQLG